MSDTKKHLYGPPSSLYSSIQLCELLIQNKVISEPAVCPAVSASRCRNSWTNCGSGGDQGKLEPLLIGCAPPCVVLGLGSCCPGRPLYCLLVGWPAWAAPPWRRLTHMLCRKSDSFFFRPYKFFDSGLETFLSRTNSTDPLMVLL